MKKYEPINISIPLTLFKLKGDACTYILGTIDISYICTYRIQNPMFITTDESGTEFSGCNGILSNEVEFSILLDKENVLYKLQQDFIPKEITKNYREFWQEREINSE